MSQNSTTIGAAHGYEKRAFRRFFADLGPGLITGAADDDPSGISTYSIAGASLGYAPLWTALFSFPLMASVQLMCATEWYSDLWVCLSAIHTPRHPAIRTLTATRLTPCPAARWAPPSA